MNTIETLLVRLIGDSTSYARMLTTAQSMADRTAASVGAAATRIQGYAAQLDGFGQRAMAVMAGLGLSLSAVGIARTAVSLAADAEQMQISFETMLGSAQLGRQMVQELVQFAATTPMELPGIQRSARLLMQFGVAAGDVIPTMRMLGDVTAGDNERFQSMSLAFAQMSAAGRLMGQDLLQMVNAGFNPLREISVRTGQSMTDLRRQMEAGQITVEMVTDAFRSATGEGGQFFNLMERQSQTVTGLFSTMRDNIAASLRVIGGEIIQSLNLREVIRWVIRTAQEFNAWITGISPQTKRVAAAILMATMAVIGLGVAIAALRPITLIAFGGFPAIVMMAAMVAASVVSIGLSFDNTRASILSGAESAMAALSQIGEAARSAYTTAERYVIQWVIQNRQAVAAVVALVTVIGTAVAIFRVLRVAFLTANALLALFHIQQIVGIGLWVAWKLTVFAATAAIATFQAVLAATSFVVGLAATAYSLWTAGTLVAKAATWLLNAALTVMNILLSPVTIITATVAVLMLAAAFVAVVAVLAVIGAAAVAAYNTLGEILHVLQVIPTTTGPLGAVGEMFGEWIRILREVITLAQTDLPRAWELFRAGGSLAFNQLRDLFPPLWTFIQNGFEILSELVANTFSLQFQRSLVSVVSSIAQTFDLFGISAVVGLEEELERMNQAVDAAQASATSLAQAQMRNAVRQFEVTESAATRAARTQLNQTRNSIWAAQLLEDQWSQFPGAEVAAEAFETGRQIGQGLTRGTEREVRRFDALLAGSAESIARVLEYTESLSREIAGTAGGGAAAGGAAAVVAVPAGGGGMVPVQPAAAPGQGAGNAAQRIVEELLRVIARNTTAMAQQAGAQVEVVDIE